MATPQEGAPALPTKVCPHCAVQSQTAADKCPNCGKSYKVKVKKSGGCLRIFLGLVGIIVVIAVIAAISGGGKSKPVTAADVTQRVAGKFVRSGCFGCTNTDKIATSDVYCGWDGKNAIVHVLFANSSAETLKVNWHPSYLIRNGTSHGTGLTSMKETKIAAGSTVEVFNKQSPAGTTAGTPIAKCYPSFFNVQAG
jgi:hypothetical protein